MNWYAGYTQCDHCGIYDNDPRWCDLCGKAKDKGGNATKTGAPPANDAMAAQREPYPMDKLTPGTAPSNKL